MMQTRGGAVTGVESGDLDGIVGLGHDVVALDAFAGQLEEPGGGMRRLFSPRELRQSALRGRLKADGEGVHLAARWRVKRRRSKRGARRWGSAPRFRTPWTPSRGRVSRFLMMRVACRMSFLRMRSLERWKIPWIKPLMGLPGGGALPDGEAHGIVGIFR